MLGTLRPLRLRGPGLLLRTRSAQPARAGDARFGPGEHRPPPRGRAAGAGARRAPVRLLARVGAAHLRAPVARDAPCRTSTSGPGRPRAGPRPGSRSSCPRRCRRACRACSGPAARPSTSPAPRTSGSRGTSDWTNRQIGLLGQQRSLFPTLNMQQDLDIRLEGQLSDRIKVNLLQNSANQIPLANRIAINYRGDEDDLVQALDLGNTNLTLPGTQYVSYSGRNEGLFGVKTTLRYGPLDFTVLASKQEGKSERASYSGGASATIADAERLRLRPRHLLLPLRPERADPRHRRDQHHPLPRQRRLHHEPHHRARPGAGWTRPWAPPPRPTRPTRCSASSPSSRPARTGLRDPARRLRPELQDHPPGAPDERRAAPGRDLPGPRRERERRRRRRVRADGHRRPGGRPGGVADRADEAAARAHQQAGGGRGQALLRDRHDAGALQPGAGARAQELLPDRRAGHRPHLVLAARLPGLLRPARSTTSPAQGRPLPRGARARQLRRERRHAGARPRRHGGRDGRELDHDGPRLRGLRERRALPARPAPLRAAPGR